jgi:homoisocitrate dehydrogenase
MKTAFADRMITERASKRIGRMAFDIAVKRGESRAQKVAKGEEVIWKRNPRVTIVHKSNVLSVTDGLFRESVHAVKAEEPRFKGVDVDEQLVDSMVWVSEAPDESRDNVSLPPVFQIPPLPGSAEL